MGFNTPKSVACPDCGGPMKPRTGKFGTFWGCFKFPFCHGTRDANGMSKQDRADAQDDCNDDEPIRWDRRSI